MNILGTIGIEIAILSVFAPNRASIIVKYATKAMIGGNFSSFMNACIAGKYCVFLKEINKISNIY
jgi:nucleoside permease NupC